MSRGVFDGRRGGSSKLYLIIIAIVLGVIGYNLFKGGHPIIGAFLIVSAIAGIFIG